MRARLTWTVGLLVYLVHVAYAFHTMHDWDHRFAAWHTGIRTWQATGFYWEGGLWINYAFTCVWVADVLYWWWVGLEGYAARRPWIGRAVRIFCVHDVPGRRRVRPRLESVGHAGRPA